jgi:hypothetical protein
MKTTQQLIVAGLALALVVGIALVLSSRSSVEGPPPPSAGDTAAVVGRIGDAVITRTELEDRLVRDIRPRDEEYAPVDKSVTAEATLREMLAEKAMSLEGRRLGYLKDEQLYSSIQQSEHQRLANMVVENYLREHPPTQEQIEQAQKANPQLSADQARITVQRQFLEQYRRELAEKLQLKKLQENFTPAALIHQRLLHKPVEPRGANEYWIKNSQVRNELSEKEKSLPLATFQGGQFTLKDWLGAVCNIAPPRRPGDLNTPAGVERLLDSAVWLHVLVAEAKLRGYDKDEKLRHDIRQLEDQRLLYKVMEEKTKGLAEPTPEQVKEYFEKNTDRFSQSATLKLSQIWCENLETAQKAKAELDREADFEAVRIAHSLQKEEVPYPVSASAEGLFWAELCKGEPNQVLGPVRGFYGSGVKWRLVKVLEKTPAQPQVFSEQIANNLKWVWMDEQRQGLLAKYREELLAKYPHEIFLDRIKGMDPLEIAMGKGD